MQWLCYVAHTILCHGNALVARNPTAMKTICGAMSLIKLRCKWYCYHDTTIMEITYYLSQWIKLHGKWCNCHTMVVVAITPRATKCYRRSTKYCNDIVRGKCLYCYAIDRCMYHLLLRRQAWQVLILPWTWILRQSAIAMLGNGQLWL
jgi:hypothetical protein